MNKNQKIVIVIAVCVITLMLLFPPFLYTTYEGGTLNAGYGFLLIPPHGIAFVNLGLLLMQWVIVGLIGGVAVYLLKKE
jgi:hypothetical protein